MLKANDKITIKVISHGNMKGIQIEGAIGDLFKTVKEEEFVRREGIIEEAL